MSEKKQNQGYTKQEAIAVVHALVAVARSNDQAAKDDFANRHIWAKEYLANDSWGHNFQAIIENPEHKIAKVRDPLLKIFKKPAMPETLFFRVSVPAITGERKIYTSHIRFFKRQDGMFEFTS